MVLFLNIAVAILVDSYGGICHLVVFFPSRLFHSLTLALVVEFLHQ